VNVVFFLLGDSPASEILCTDVSEHTFCSILIGGVPMEMDKSVPKRRYIKFQKQGDHPKERIRSITSIYGRTHILKSNAKAELYFRVLQSRNQLNTRSPSQSLCSVLNPRHVSGVKHPSSGETTLAVFDVSCVHL
jgi:hypothetical protein